MLFSGRVPSLEHATDPSKQRWLENTIFSLLEKRDASIRQKTLSLPTRHTSNVLPR